MFQSWHLFGKYFIFVMFWCYNDTFRHCNEKGIRLESVTVPAAVMPDHVIRDDGFMKYLPLFRFIGMGRLQKTGISQKTCHKD